MKEKLMMYGQVNERINELIDDLEILFSLAMKTTQTITDMPRGGSSSREEIYAKIADKQTEINAEIDYLCDIKIELCQMIKKLDDKTHRAVVAYKYIKAKEVNGYKVIGYTINQIARELHMSRRKVLTIHGIAIKELHNI